ncbi:MAG: Holliday junction DNA helicase RuvA [Bacteroidetes bacterium GWC2_33_15]|nr:MAG: Holliday junction DNA helicase RuvA [Bacteroidetes bacterium GWA2_33_15]OFX49345.1 MAG: Holliday junction DNA helicase RuvA [Bacteroidetes bacterium GWC2_33_15]OFX63062.1 MAG: Holliday junction DNA helicase RuvA [Bacteroidetes bacterium GWB2_32_14]OFX68693.1 MAG: Holliday junction DNA helicase RuvA [Bacteroidetes bacterium GWD2_33_33]HAN19141.1 Holliday junction branch migration protein RuvA [Bacteroidales bacterium]
MYEFIKGKIQEIFPTYLVLENSEIGYFIHISVNTYSKISGHQECMLYIHEVIREDAHLLFGFFDKKERDIFLQLISVSGIGANTARMMLSSLSPGEIQTAIMQGNVPLLKSIKGVGAKTAERIIVDLRDKVGKLPDGLEIITHSDNTIKEEALSALVMLGFPKAKIEKLLSDILKEFQGLTVENLVKEALKRA